LVGCCECNKFLDFLKLFEDVDMGCSFPMWRYMLRLDSWFKSYEVLKISAKLRACCQPLPMQQNLPTIAKTAKLCQNLPKDKSLKYHQKLQL
jgi:hypothetical protein